MVAQATSFPAVAVLLAAGRGTRLGNLTREMPKCMVAVEGRTIVERAIDVLERTGFQRLLTVTGHEDHLLRGFIEEAADGRIETQFIHSADYATTNNIVSLWRVGDAVRDDFLLLESDLIFTEDVVAALPAGTAAAVSPHCAWMDGTVVCGEGGLVERFYGKQEAWPPTALYKTVNIYLIGGRDWTRTIWPRLDLRVREGRTQIYYETVFAEAVHEGRLRMRLCVVGEDQWQEVDTPEDLRRAEDWVRGHGISQCL